MTPVARVECPRCGTVVGANDLGEHVGKNRCKAAAIDRELREGRLAPLSHEHLRESHAPHVRRVLVSAGWLLWEADGLVRPTSKGLAAPPWIVGVLSTVTLEAILAHCGGAPSRALRGGGKGAGRTVDLLIRVKASTALQARVALLYGYGGAAAVRAELDARFPEEA